MSASRLAKFRDMPCNRCGAPRVVINGDWLRQRRLSAGVTLREAAKRFGVSAPYLSDIERNRRNCLPKMRANYEGLAANV